MGLRAGQLRHRVQIMQPVQTPKARGGLQTTWTAIGDPVPALVEGLGGREATIGQAFDGIATYRVTLRFRTDLTDAFQLVWAGQTLNIRNVDASDPRRQQTVLLADTGSTQKLT